MDSSLPGSSVHGILQARILERVAICFFRGSSQPKNWTRISCIDRLILYSWATREACTYCKMITIMFIYIHHLIELQFFSCGKNFSPSNFQIYNRALLTIVTMQYITFPELIYFISGSLHLLTIFIHFPQAPNLTSGNHYVVFYFYEFSFFRFHIKVRSYSICLSLPLSIMSSRLICVVTNGRLFIFFRLNSIS